MFELINADQFVEQPWKNGGGSTLELFRFPHGGENFDIRLSIATVSRSGPFSMYPGYTRVITQLSGPPMTLEHIDPAVTKVLERASPYTFGGGHLTDCHVTGECRDFNLFVKNTCRDLKAYFVPSAESKIVELLSDGDWIFIYRPGMESRMADLPYERRGSVAVKAGNSPGLRKEKSHSWPITVSGPAFIFTLTLEE